MADVIQQLKAVSVTVDGEILLGSVNEVDIPDLELETEEIRLSGMDGTIDVETGQVKMESTISVKGIHRALAVSWGKGVPNTRVEVRGARENYDGSVSAIKYVMVGLVTMYTHAEALQGRGELPTTEININPNFYEHTIDGEVVQSIDVLNMVREIEGTDRLAEIRAAIGA